MVLAEIGVTKGRIWFMHSGETDDREIIGTERLLSRNCAIDWAKLGLEI